MDENQRKMTEERLQKLEQDLKDLKLRWPAHSLKSAMIIQLEDLEEEIANFQNLLSEK
jgi:hypothetical protein